jgi:uncharacterized protein YjhX (UPF0386 family)
LSAVYYLLTFDHSYRSTSEVQAVRKEKDAIKLVEAYALDGELATAEELKVLYRYKDIRYTSPRPPNPPRSSTKVLRQK